MVPFFTVGTCLAIIVVGVLVVMFGGKDKRPHPPTHAPTPTTAPRPRPQRPGSAEHSRPVATQEAAPEPTTHARPVHHPVAPIVTTTAPARPWLPRAEEALRAIVSD